MSDEVFAVTDEWPHPIRNAPATERPHATDGTPCWCGPAVETFGGNAPALGDSPSPGDHLREAALRASVALSEFAAAFKGRIA